MRNTFGSKHEQDSPPLPPPGKARAPLASETLEPRILMSATWVDAGDGVEIEGPTNDADIFMGSIGDDVADGGKDDDALFGAAGSDLLTGDKGDDLLLGGDGDDTLDGGKDDDTLDGGDGADTLIGDKGSDTLLGGAGDDSLEGGKNDDYLDGGAGDDTLVGGKGDDVLVGGGGNDALDGGSGDDAFGLQGAEDGDVITVEGGKGSDTIDLQSYGSGAVTSDGSTLHVDLGNGQSFQIEHENIESILTADGDLLEGGSGSAGGSGSGSGGKGGGSGSGSAASYQADWAPTADAGPDLSVSTGEAVTLDATGSSDAEGAVTYQWTQVQGPLVELSGSDTAQPTFTAGDAAGSMTFSVTVTDSAGHQHVDLVEVEVAEEAAAEAFVTVEDAQGLANQPIALNIDAGATGSGDETLTVTISGVPAGASLSAGTDNGDGTWTLTETEVDGLELTPPQDSDADFELEVTVEAESDLEETVWNVDASEPGNLTHGAPAGVTVTGLFVPDGTENLLEGKPELTTNSGHNYGSYWADPDAQTGYNYMGQDDWFEDHGVDISGLEGGVITFSDGTEGIIDIAVDGGYSGEDAYVYYKAYDGIEVAEVETATTTAEATISVTVVDLPTASAGSDLAVEENATVQLEGAGTDPAGQGLSYTWVQTGGPAVTLDDASASSPTFAAPDLLSNTDIVFELQVSDGVNTSTDTVTVTVNADNDAPSAEAGATQVVTEGDSVQLAGSGTDPEGQGLTYTWVQTSGPEVVLSDSSAAAPTFESPDVTAATELQFELQVSDGENTSVDTVTITVEQVESGLVADAGADLVVDEGNSVQLTADTDWEASAIDFSSQTLESYGGSGQDRDGSYESFGDGDGVHIEGNSWASIELPYTITEDTILEFDYRASGDAEISGIGFDSDSSISSDKTFKMSGTQNWGLSSGFDTYTEDADEWQHVQIRVGDFYTGEVDNLFFVNDHDGGSRDSEAFFANVKVYEDGANAPQDATYTWVQTGGTPVVLDDANATTPTFTAPEGLVNSELTFELQVSDGTSTVTDTVTVTVNADNDAPSATAGANQSVEENASVQLAGSGTDPEGEGLSYTWVQTSGPSVTLDDANASAPTFDAPDLLSNTDITFELQVSDGVNTSTDSVTITVNADNDAPSANAGPDQGAAEDSVVQLAGSGTDPEGQGLAYEWVQTGGPEVTLDDASSSSPTFTAPNLAGDEDITFELRVSDGEHTTVDTVSITIEADDDAPIEVSAGADRVVDELDVVQLSGSGSDLEGQDLTYTWVQTGGPTVALDDPHASSPSFTAPDYLSNTDLTFELQVSDGTHTTTDTVNVTVHADDDAPSAAAGHDQVVSEHDLVNLHGHGTDPEEQGLSYTWVQTAGPAVVLDDPHAAEASFHAPEGLVNSDIVFELQISDGVNTSTDEVTITVEADNDAPSAHAGPDQLMEEGEVVTLSGSGLDPEAQGLTYTWVQTSGPSVGLDDAHAQSPIFTAPNELSNTDITFELQVSDGVNTSVDTVTITVNADNDAPTANAGLDQSVDENSIVQMAGAGFDPEGEDLSYRWVQTGGPLVTLDDPTAAAPTFEAPEGLVNSNITFELWVSDGEQTSSDTLTITVNANNDAPLAEAGPTQAVSEDGHVQLAGKGYDPEGQELSYTWTQVGGPAVELADASGPNASFDAPNFVSNTDLVFELQVSDGVNTSVDTVTIQVNADNDAPTADAGSAQGVFGESIVQLSGAGSDIEGQGLTYEWVQTGGPAVELLDGDTDHPSFIAPAGESTQVTFELRVSDGTSTSVDTVNVQVMERPEVTSVESSPPVERHEAEEPVPHPEGVRGGDPSAGALADEVAGLSADEPGGGEDQEQTAPEELEASAEVAGPAAPLPTALDLGSLLPAEVTAQGFDSVFVEADLSDIDLAAPHSALPVQESQRAQAPASSEIVEERGSAGEESLSSAKDAGLLAKFWSLMRGAAGTTSSAKPTDDKHTKN